MASKRQGLTPSTCEWASFFCALCRGTDGAAEAAGTWGQEVCRCGCVVVLAVNAQPTSPGGATWHARKVRLFFYVLLLSHVLLRLRMCRYNTHVVLDSTGSTVATYRKVGAAQPPTSFCNPPATCLINKAFHTATLWQPLQGRNAETCRVCGERTACLSLLSALLLTTAWVCMRLQVHLFDVDVPDGPVLMESRTTAPGNKVGCTGLLAVGW